MPRNLESITVIMGIVAMVGMVAIQEGVVIQVDMEVDVLVMDTAVGAMDTVGGAMDTAVMVVLGVGIMVGTAINHVKTEDMEVMAAMEAMG